MNGDGFPDIIVVGNGGGPTSSVFLNNGQGGFSSSSPLSVNPLSYPYTNLTLVDINRDGNLDVVLTDSTGNVSIYFGNGDGTLSSTPLLAPERSSSAWRGF